MENTPNSCSDSGCYFDTSRSLFESTPKAESECTPLSTASRKRKASYFENFKAKNLADVIELSPTSPQFSSTFNESLSNNLEKFHLKNDESIVEDQQGASKIFKSCGNVSKKFRSAPSTPEKQIKHIKDVGRKRIQTAS
ncbi:hypothetical protein NQ317_002094 [Molorchus minor]|uniref:Uncharacterized protein n=1 Tax=Molorchus minor TaxID=1323400 RepID=A0ABQ9JWF1_9CUCU|nr:hypothetical protein NQ317_002094 [Molorchus minor]